MYYVDTEGRYWDEVSHKLLESSGVIAARLDEIKQIYEHRVYEKVPIEECHRVTGKAPIKVKWVDLNKGDEINKEYRSRLVAKEIKLDNGQDLFAATPPLEVKKMLFSLAVTEGVGYCVGHLEEGMKIDFVDISRAFFQARRPTEESLESTMPDVD